MNETHTPPTEVAVVLGRVTALALREVELTLGRAGHRVAELTVASGVALVKADPKPGKSWFSTLGGATKFGWVLARTAPTIEAVTAVLEGAPTVGFSVVGVPVDAVDLGRTLKEQGKTRRYVLPGEGGVFSAAQSKAVDREYLILGVNGYALVIEIEAAQDIDAFTLRDRGLPVADPLRGMLPTKLARAMVNLGLGLVPSVKRPVLLDPFCGTGRILLEAALLDAQILGADIDPVAVDATRQNLAWAVRRLNPAIAPVDPDQILTAPIHKLPSLLSSQSIDMIVTEPSLGPPLRAVPSTSKVESLFDELVPTYEALFRAANHLLVPNGALVVVFPAIGERSLLETMIDRIGDFGYHAPDHKIKFPEGSRSAFPGYAGKAGQEVEARAETDYSIRVERPDSIVARDIATLVRT